MRLNTQQKLIHQLVSAKRSEDGFSFHFDKKYATRSTLFLYPLNAIRNTRYFFMQNEPNPKNSEIALSHCNIKDYADFTILTKHENEPKRTQFEPKTKPNEPNLCHRYLCSGCPEKTEKLINYENCAHFVLNGAKQLVQKELFLQNKANLKNNRNAISTCFINRYDILNSFSRLKNKAKQSQFKPIFSLKLGLFLRNKANLTRFIAQYWLCFSHLFAVKWLIIKIISLWPLPIYRDKLCYPWL